MIPLIARILSFIILIQRRIGNRCFLFSPKSHMRRM